MRHKYFKRAVKAIFVFIGIQAVSGSMFSQTDNSLYFGEDSTYVATVPFDTIRNKELTLECWFKMQSDSSDQVLFDFGDDESNYYRFNLNSKFWGGIPVFTLGKGGLENQFQRFSVKVPKNIWTHLTVTLKVKNSITYVKIYLNGVLMSNKFYGADFSLPLLRENYIGKSRTNKIFRDGLVDEFRIWNRALTSNEVAENYTKKFDSYEDNFLAYYKFNKEETDLDTVYDVSNNGYNAKIHKIGVSTWSDEIWSDFEPNIYFVTEDGVGNGTSWSNSTSDLQKAIDSCASHGGGEVWVKAGIYHPLYQYDGGNDDGKKKAFVLSNGVNIYGGFNGTETSKEQRELSANETILSGDIGTVNDSTDNVYHVVYAEEILPVYGINNVVITGGYAYGGNGTLDILGGGAYLNGGKIANCVVRKNTASNSGGGLFLRGAARVENTLIDSNYSASNGGGISLSYGGFVKGCIIATNKAPNNGGGIFLKTDGDGELINSKLLNNTAAYGGGLYQKLGGSVYNNVFTNNYATWGGGAYFQSCSSTNNTFAFNLAGNGGGAIINDGTISNALFWGNEATSYSNQAYNYGLSSIIQYCAIDGYTLDDNNIRLTSEDSDSVANFIAQVSFVGLAENQDKLNEALSADYKLQQGSICIGKGSNSLVAGIDFDAVGNNRVSYDTVDVGAYEAVFATSYFNDTVLVYNATEQVPQDISTSPEGLVAKVVGVHSIFNSATESINADTYIATIEIDDDAYVGVSYDTFRIAKAEQTITFDDIETKSVQDEDFALHAVSTSLLPIRFESSNSLIATINNDSIVNILQEGTILITASQEGNSNYYAAEPVQKTLIIEPSSNIEEIGSDKVVVYPNPSNSGEQITISIGEGLLKAARYSLYTSSGKLLIQKEKADSKFYLPQLKAGFYILRVDYNKNTYQTKLIVN